MKEHEDMDKRLAVLIDEYGDSVLRMCYLYLKDYQLAEDVAQETFIRVYQHYGEFKKQSSIKTWILQIAINLCKNQIRTKWWKTRSEYEIPEISEDGYYDSFLDRQMVLQEISKLSIKYREVILLYYYQELSISDISELLGEKESTIKTRLVRARNKLKPELKEVFCYE